MIAADWLNLASAAAFTVACAWAWIVAINERRLRKHYETEAAQQRHAVAFYANAYAEARWPRTRSQVSEAREGFAVFTTVDELTAVKR